MKVKNYCVSEVVKFTMSFISISFLLFMFSGDVSAYTTAGTVKFNDVPVTDVTVYLIDCNTNMPVGNCHTDGNGYFIISVMTSNPCQVIAIPDNVDAVYVPTYYPNQVDSRRGFVIYPADMPEDVQIEPVSYGEAIVNSMPVKITGHINNVNLSGISAYIYVMNGNNVLSCHKVDAAGNFSFTTGLNSSSSIKITNIGYNTIDLKYDNLNLVNDGDLASCSLNLDMIISGNGSVVTPSSMESLHVSPNYPNPFNPTTKINYIISTSGLVKIMVYDLSGRLVSNLLNEFKTPGSYSVTFNASNLSSGIYYYSVENGNARITKQMMLIK